jgi:hypothetical protein
VRHFSPDPPPRSDSFNDTLQNLIDTVLGARRYNSEFGKLGNIMWRDIKRENMEVAQSLQRAMPIPFAMVYNFIKNQPPYGIN